MLRPVLDWTERLTGLPTLADTQVLLCAQIIISKHPHTFTFVQSVQSINYSINAWLQLRSSSYLLSHALKHANRWLIAPCNHWNDWGCCRFMNFELKKRKLYISRRADLLWMRKNKMTNKLTKYNEIPLKKKKQKHIPTRCANYFKTGKCVLSTWIWTDKLV